MTTSRRVSRSLNQIGNTANFSGLPVIRHSPSDTWRCRVCGYGPNVDRISPLCVGCGRDFWGNPGERPDFADKVQHARESGEF